MRFQGEGYVKDKLKQLINHGAESPKETKPSRENQLSRCGRGGGRGAVLVVEHVRGEAGFRVCDVLA